MIEMLYGDIDLAYIILALDMDVQAAGAFIKEFWTGDRMFLHPFYRDNLRKLILDVYYWRDYLCNKSTIDKELPQVAADFNFCGKKLNEGLYSLPEMNLDLFFKTKRAQILYAGGQDFVRMKLRTLLSTYGYQRRSAAFIEYVRKSLTFYHMQMYLRGNEECDIADISLDSMITLRVI